MCGLDTQIRVKGRHLSQGFLTRSHSGLDCSQVYKEVALSGSLLICQHSLGTCMGNAPETVLNFVMNIKPKNKCK